MKAPFIARIGLCATLISAAALPGLAANPAAPSWITSAETRPHPAVARIVASEGRGASYGSGTLVGVDERYGLVVTNWHVVRDAAGPVSVIFPDGFHSPATILATDHDWDLAALAIWRPNVLPVPLATQAPRPGEPLWIAGYGQGSFRMAGGRCLQYVSPGRSLPSQMVEVSAAARNGDSGGPILNARGELAGVLFGTSFGTTMGSYCGRVDRFLASVSDDFRALPDPPHQATPPHGLEAVMLADLPPTEWTGADESSTATRSPLPRGPAIAVEPTAALASDRASRSVVEPGAASDDPAANLEPQFQRVGPVAVNTPLRWSDIAGKTPVDQIKSVLAAIGAIALLLQGFRLLGVAQRT